MSTYYKYNFVSPAPIFSIIKEELKSYFDSGAIDDLMFPTYLNKCLNHLGKGTYEIIEDILYLEGSEARLPDNFHSLREAWLCADINGTPYRTPNSFYSQAISEDTIQVSPVTVGGTICQNVSCSNSACNGTECMPEIIQSVYKTNYEITQSFRKMYLLRPGTISSRDRCSSDCKNFGSTAPDIFDIRDNKFITNFTCGTVYIIFYAENYSEEGVQLIPDNYYIKEYIEKYIKYKMFETLSNQTYDETFNQISQKALNYKQQSDEAFILALVEMRRETANQKIDRIKNKMNRFNMYELPTRSKYRKRRN